jgi:hypothetical protein
MKNIVVLQKNEDGYIECQQITEKGKKYMLDGKEDEGHWEEGGTILLDELEEILDRDI